MPTGSVLELQQKLFKRIGVESLPRRQGPATRSRHGSFQSLARKEERRSKRTRRKAQRYSKHPPASVTETVESNKGYDGRGKPSAIHLHSTSEFSPKAEEDMFMGHDTASGSSDETEGWDDSLDKDLAEKPKQSPKGGSISKTLKDKLAQDDADIEEFERKLGMRKGRRSLPQAFKDDGLDEIIGEIGEDTASSEDEVKKRKRAYDDWLSLKRRKSESEPIAQPFSVRASGQSYESIRDGSVDDLTDDSSAHYSDLPYDDSEDSHGRGIDHRRRVGGEPGTTVAEYANHRVDEPGGNDESIRSVDPPERENPYVAPTEGKSIFKYIPPSRRHGGAGSEHQAQSHLQKRLRGLVNRLTDANIISILQSVEEIYQSNARGEVTEILTDSILAQMRRAESLNDQFFVLVGGFSAAVYKITGSSFGSHMVRRVVNEFGEYYGQASDHGGSHQGLTKESSNFLTFLTQLYVFDVIGCRIIFDFMEKLLDSLSELNVELLLRVCRMAGKLLRRDDPQALKHVSYVLNSSVNKLGYTNVSVRTKFMIETIQGLKNSKPRAKGMDSAIVSEHVLRMKKRLGELKSQSRRLEGLAPMGIGLKDIETIDKHGRWWLVGASVPTYHDAEERAKIISAAAESGHDNTLDDEDMDFVLPDYPSKAKAQGLNTTAQVAIFTAIMSALNYEHGYRQFVGLKLKRDEQLEITRVLVQCVGSEPSYNEYYALVGGQACVNSRIRFAFQDRLWKTFRNLGESLFGEGAEADEVSGGEGLRSERRLGNMAQFYASLVANGHLSISLLKPLDLPGLNQWSALFVELFLLSLLRECKGKKTNEDMKVESVFGPAKGQPSLAANLHWFLRKRIPKSKHVRDRERKSMQQVWEKAQETVHESKKAG